MKHAATAIGIFATLLAATSSAHHSFAALFDSTRTIVLTGTVVKFEFRAPHAYIHLSVGADDGRDTLWELETAPPGMLTRKGITPHTIRLDERIAVEGNPSRDGRPLIRLLTITLADGQTVDMQ
jgi:hypothetical protein